MQQRFLLFLISILCFTACNQSKKENTNTDTTSTTAVVNPPRVESVVIDEKKYHELALYLAGLPQEEDNAYSKLQQLQAWKDYSRQADARWKAFNSQKLTRMESWAAGALQEVRKETKTILYPFSGPDFLNVFTFFPTAETYTMIGLEPIGLLPEIDKIPKDSLPSYFHSVQQSLASILSLSFFKTIDMAVDFKSEQLDGIATDLFIFIARTGNRITSVRPIAVNDQGGIVASEYVSASKVSKNGIYGIEIHFKTKEGESKELHYFSADLWDRSLQQHTGFLKLLQNQGKVTAYLKSASYLMHKDYFSEIRNILLTQSKFLLQDDSGIPYRFFVPKIWDVKLFGSYTKPINLFKDWFQEDLKKAYDDSTKTIAPLKFGIGYNFQVYESNLMLIQKK